MCLEMAIQSSSDLESVRIKQSVRLAASLKAGTVDGSHGKLALIAPTHCFEYLTVVPIVRRSIDESSNGPTFSDHQGVSHQLEWP